MTRVMASCAVVLVVLTAGVAVEWAPLIDLDHWLSRHAFAATHGQDVRTAVWTAITDGAAPEPMRNALLVAAVVALLLKRLDLAAWLAALSVVEGIVAPLSKQLLERPRPEWADPIVVLASTSYPSGHATAAATTAVALALAVRHRAVLVAAVVLAISVAASRVFLGAHYPTDVVAGLAFGTLLATSSYALVGAVTGTARWRRSGPAAPRTAPQVEAGHPR